VFNESAVKHGATEEDIRHAMSEEEADFWDEYFTRNTIMPDPTRPGVIARTGQIFGYLPNDVADYLCEQASAAHCTQADVVGRLVREKMASLSGKLCK
jgi:hypothetical protein